MGLTAPWCAPRGRIATPAELARLKAAPGFVGSGQLRVSSPLGRFRAPILIGVARPDRIRLEVLAGPGASFVLVSRDGLLGAEYPVARARFEGKGDRSTIASLFGASLAPDELVGALLGAPPPRARFYEWRFESGAPRNVRLHLSDGSRLDFILDGDEAAPELKDVEASAFTAPAPSESVRSVDVDTMARLLGLRGPRQ
jgi:hypothetical protein